MSGRATMALAAILILVVSTVGCGDSAQETPTPAATATPTTTPAFEPITLKLISSPLPTSPDGRTYQHFADLVEQYTGGRVAVDVYPGSQLFPATEQWEAVVTGAVDVFADSVYYFFNAVPDVMIFFIDGFWESYEQAYAALEDTELPQILAAKAEEAGPVKMLGVLPGVMTAVIVNNVRETKQLKDLEGFKVQSSPGAPPAAVFDYTGMVGVPLSYEEVSAAFIQGILDAVQRPAHVIKEFGTYEPARHALARTAWLTAYAILINEDSWESLTANDRDIILNRVMPEVYDFAKTTFREAEANALELIEQNVETMHWVGQEDMNGFLEFAMDHPITKTQLLMVEPRIIEIIEELRPGGQ